MRLLTSELRRRCRRSSPTPLFNFLSDYSYRSPNYNNYHNYSHSLSNTSIQHNHHQNWRSKFIPGCSLQLHSISLYNRHGFNRRFSTEPDFQGSDEPLLPVKALISLLDSYHDVTGFPWWIIISSSTVALRLGLFPLIVLQLRKLARIGELMPKLPPPFPPPLSGRSFRDQFALFKKEKKAVGCPSFLWFFFSLSVQVPCFFLWLMSVRKMSLSDHPGFDTGGALWFQNLTEYPHGMLGPVFPLLIAGLHFTNVKMSFQKSSSLQNMHGPLGLLARAYKVYLQLLTLPILFATFNVPQGSLVYWLTNSSMNLIQLLCLHNPSIRERLGLPKTNLPVPASIKKPEPDSVIADTFIQTKKGPISAESLSPVELVSYSIKILTDGRNDIAMRFLRLALEKDPGNVRAMLILGQTLLQNKQFVDANEYLERAISKLLEAGFPTEVEQVDLLILSSQWAGIANAQQGKMEEAVRHLERITQLEEPEDAKSKAHYYDGLFILSSALLNVDRKDEAFMYLTKAAAYNPAYNAYFEHFDTEPKDFASNLASRRDI